MRPVHGHVRGNDRRGRLLGPRFVARIRACEREAGDGDGDAATKGFSRAERDHRRGAFAGSGEDAGEEGRVVERSLHA